MKKTYEDFKSFVYKELDKDLSGYCVLPEKTIKQIWEKKPITWNQMKDIPGLPQDGKRFEKYAEKIFNYFKLSGTSIF